MRGEVFIGGVYIPSLLLLAILAFLAFLPVRAVLERIGFYRWMGSRPLSDLALFVLLLGLLVFLTLPGSAGHHGLLS
ncbi:DUF1656 domain-containing protein [Stakelama pacifica]|uniref:Uncharacterized protein DUF1656 n=1 Tax=Stakelama pacifica TaxID=517720 RepID=A0A4R6FD69_9SPHN|nr:DUF1656 domain-containing protein [Stakelama pacifica]TDN79027.1 uncharacterized protein DUF1656 [Stakelama pacifica]GGO98827.1 hypothetical protein GCM10011329_30880 [Stakelama pacifica]